MASSDSQPTTDDEARYAGFLQRTLASALAPVRNIISTLTSQPAKKAYIITALFTFASLALLGVSTAAYLLFYYNYVPQIGLERVVHLQFSDTANPSSLLYLSTSPTSPSPLISQQPYDISLNLHLPRTSNNLALGNFMLDLSLLSPSTTSTTSSSSLTSLLDFKNSTRTLAHSRRPAILTQTSPPLHHFTTLVALPWYLLGLRPLRNLESENLIISMFERVEFPRGQKNVPSMARVELVPPVLQTSNIPNPISGGTGAGPDACIGINGQIRIYSLTLSVRARFSGLRWLMYNHRIVSYATFSAAFYTISLLSMSIAWLALSFLLPSSQPPENDASKTQGRAAANGKAIKSEPEPVGRPRIKREEDGDDESAKSEPRDGDGDEDRDSDDALPSLSDTNAASPFPTLGRQMPLRMPVPVPATSTSGGRERGSSIRAPAGDSTTAAASSSRAAGVERERERQEEAEADDEGEGEGEDVGGAFRDSGIGTSVEERERERDGVMRRRGGEADGDGDGGWPGGGGLQRRRSGRGWRDER